MQRFVVCLQESDALQRESAAQAIFETKVHSLQVLITSLHDYANAIITDFLPAYSSDSLLLLLLIKSTVIFPFPVPYSIVLVLVA